MSHVYATCTTLPSNQIAPAVSSSPASYVFAAHRSSSMASGYSTSSVGGTAAAHHFGTVTLRWNRYAPKRKKMA